MGALKVWDGTAWQMAMPDAVLPCTHATRPTVPWVYNGQVVYETDTKTYFVYNTALSVPAWEPILFLGNGRPFIGRGRVSSISIPNITVTPLSYPDTLTDGGLQGFTTSDNINFVVPYRGIYQINASVGWTQGSPSGRGQITLARNGTPTTSNALNLAVLPGTNSQVSVNAALKLDVGDTIRAQVYQNTGVAWTVEGGVSAMQFTAYYVGPGPIA